MVDDEDRLLQVLLAELLEQRTQEKAIVGPAGTERRLRHCDPALAKCREDRRRTVELGGHEPGRTRSERLPHAQPGQGLRERELFSA